MIEKDRGCGIFGFRPKWLQSFAKSIVVVILMVGIRFTNKLSEKYLSATLSTTEKYFGFKTKEMSLVIAANDITAIFLTIPMIFYLNKKNKAFWCGLGQMIAALANFLPLLAYLVVPGSYVTKTIESKEEIEFCTKNHGSVTEECDEDAQVKRDWGNNFALVCFFFCKLAAGVAQQTYWTLGIAYMDDNVRSTSSAAVLGICYMAGYLGGFAGKMLGSACLNYTPEDRELGAWWLGWPLIAVGHSCLAFGFLLLPVRIQKKEANQVSENEMEKLNYVAPAQDSAKIETSSSFLSQLGQDVRRLLGNRLLVFDSLAMSFFLFATTNGSHKAKFVELQFLTSASAASLFSGSATMIGMITALGISIIVISWFKPHAKFLAGFNVIADLLAFILGIAFIFVDCDHSGVVKPTECFTDCGCSATYKPVCDLATSRTYFSVCAAGCTDIAVTGYSIAPASGTNTSLTSASFIGCSCALSGSVERGYCHTSDCYTPLMAFLITQFAVNLILGLGRVGNLLVHIKCVEEKDKALGMAIQEVSLALIAFIPGEILFGSLVDSACTLWNEVGCGKTGHCLDYDLPDFRQKFFGVSAAGFFIAAIFDGLVWNGVEHLDIY